MIIWNRIFNNLNWLRNIIYIDIFSEIYLKFDNIDILIYNSNRFMPYDKAITISSKQQYNNNQNEVLI